MIKLTGRDLYVFRKATDQQAATLGYDETVGLFGHSLRDMYYWRELATKEGRNEDVEEWKDLLCRSLNG